MEKATLSALIAMTVLTGCSPAEDQVTIDEYVRQESARLATQQLEQDKKELAIALAEAKAKDPKIKDMYYSVDDKGERQLNIVREPDAPTTVINNNYAQPNNDGLETFTYALLGAGAVAWMANSFRYNPSYSSSYYRNNTTSYYRGTRKENDDRRSGAVSTYISSTNRGISNNVHSKVSTGSYSSSKGGSISTSRPAFGSSGSRGASVGG